MRTSGILGFASVLLVCLGVAFLNSADDPQHVAYASESEAAVEPAEHPELDEDLPCADCHEDEADAWYGGKHGMNNIKCFVCHGSIEDNYMPEPPMERCIGCHADQVASMETEFMEGKNCFTCHTNHSLSPHVSPVHGGER